MKRFPSVQGRGRWRKVSFQRSPQPLLSKYQPTPEGPLKVFSIRFSHFSISNTPPQAPSGSRGTQLALAPSASAALKPARTLVSLTMAAAAPRFP